jgi:hypothetical protein
MGGVRGDEADGEEDGTGGGDEGGGEIDLGDGGGAGDEDLVGGEDVDAVRVSGGRASDGRDCRRSGGEINRENRTGGVWCRNEDYAFAGVGPR